MELQWLAETLIKEFAGRNASIQWEKTFGVRFSPNRGGAVMWRIAPGGNRSRRSERAKASLIVGLSPWGANVGLSVRSECVADGRGLVAGVDDERSESGGP